MKMFYSKYRAPKFFFGFILGIASVISCRVTSIDEARVMGDKMDVSAEDKPIFSGTIINKICQNIKNFENICLVTIDNLEADETSSERNIAILFDGDFDLYTGKFVKTGAAARVDLNYTDQIDNKAALRDLKNKFGEKYKYFYHKDTDPTWSNGEFNDVIVVQSRD